MHPSRRSVSKRSDHIKSSGGHDTEQIASPFLPQKGLSLSGNIQDGQPTPKDGLEVILVATSVDMADQSEPAEGISMKQPHTAFFVSEHNANVAKLSYARGALLAMTTVRLLCVHCELNVHCATTLIHSRF